MMMIGEGIQKFCNPYRVKDAILPVQEETVEPEKLVDEDPHAKKKSARGKIIATKRVHYAYSHETTKVGRRSS